jgi:hypothetical protein
MKMGMNPEESHDVLPRDIYHRIPLNSWTILKNGGKLIESSTLDQALFGKIDEGAMTRGEAWTTPCSIG